METLSGAPIAGIDPPIAVYIPIYLEIIGISAYD